MQIDRPLEIAAFLDQHQWGEAATEPVAAHFSTRRYARLTQPNGHTAILMDADADQRTPQFVAIDKILRKLDINAPEIYAADAERGLVLMQDFGIRNVGALLDQGAKPEEFLFRAADILAKLHNSFDREEILGLDIPLFNAELFTHQAEWFLDIYFPYINKREASDEERQDFRAAWLAVLRPLETLPKSLLLRDYMPDNLMDLANGKLGVLDFELAGVGCIAYDLASLCEEIRRDGVFDFLPDVIAHYYERLNQGVIPISKSNLHRACIIFSAQRHTRHLANVTRMATQRGQMDKLAFLPRVQRHLKQILNEPYLMPVKEWMERFKGILG